MKNDNCYKYITSKYAKFYHISRIEYAIMTIVKKIYIRKSVPKMRQVGSGRYCLIWSNFPLNTNATLCQRFTNRDVHNALL